MGWLSNEISNAKRIKTVLEKLIEKQTSSHFNCPLIDGVPLQRISMNLDEAVSEISLLISQAPRQFDIVKMNTICTNGKNRSIVKLCGLDLIVHHLVATIFTEVFENKFSANLFSYRKGKSNVQAVRLVQKYMAEHRSRRSDLKTRGLCILKRDIKSYGDSIPVHPNAPLWKMISEAFVGEKTLDERDMHWISIVICPTYCNKNVTHIGLPVGSPVMTPLLNYYLHSVDSTLSKVPGSLYIRFGDDILFVCEEMEKSIQAGELLENFTHSLGLHFSAHKSSNLFVSGSGMGKENFKGAQYFEYLGIELEFAGGLLLPRKKIKKFRNELSTRLKNTMSATKHWKKNAQLELISKLLAGWLNSSEQMHLPYVDWFETLLDSRIGLEQLDWIVWEEVAMALSGQPSPACFRVWPPKKIRSILNLPSFVDLRNRRHQESQCKLIA